MTYELYRDSLSNYPFIYRNLLTIPRDVSFGLELELESVSTEEVGIKVYSKLGGLWHVKQDNSLNKDNNAEIVSPPLYNTKETWQLLQKLGKLLEYLKPTYEHCSFQVNINGELLPTEKDKTKFLKLFAVYEDIIYRFSRGNDPSLRECVDEYADTTILKIKAFKYYDSLTEPFMNQKRYAICFKDKYKSLIEFRTPNATSNPILWQNYITAFYYLVMYSLSPKCNEDELDEYIDNFNKTYLYEYYMLPHDEKAITLAKKIFRKPEDKAYFLKQYFGQ